ncbi:MAG: lipopolysaccharide biosynthesis protein [Planctomycetota bacterium]|jgi:O-antigen/teichoic acid export membrane protein
MAGGTLSKRAGIFMGAQFTAQMIGAASNMVLARVLVTEDMGSFQQLMTTYYFLSSFLIFGLPSSLTYFYPTVEKKYRATTVYVVVGGLLALGLTLGAVARFGAPVIADVWNKERLAGLLERFCLFFTFTLALTYMKRFLVSTNRYRFLAAWLPFDRLANFMAFAIPAYLGYPLETVLTTGVIVSAVKFIIAAVFTVSVVSPFSLVWNGDLIRRILLYSLPLGMSAATAHIGGFIDRLIIGRYETTEFYAIFNWGARGIRFLPVIAMSAMTVLLPELARLYKERDYRQLLFVWHESIRKVALIVLGVLAFAEVFATPFIVTLYSETYIESVPFFRLYQIRLIMRVTLFGYVLQSLGKTKIILYTTIVLILIKAPLSFGLYRLVGPYGPPISSILISAGLTAFHLLYISAKIKVRMRRIWPWVTHARILVAAGIAAAAASVVLLLPAGWIANTLLGISPWFADKPSVVSFVQLALGALVFAPVYLGLLLAFRTIKKKDLALLRDMTIGRFKKREKSEDDGRTDE